MQYIQLHRTWVVERKRVLRDRRARRIRELIARRERMARLAHGSELVMEQLHNLLGQSYIL